MKGPYYKEVQMANKCVKRCSTPLVIKEMQSKLQCHSTPHLTGWLQEKRQTKASVDRDAEKLKPSYGVGGIVNWYRHFGKQFDSRSKS